MNILQVYGWGRGEHGRLGFGDNDKSSKMVPQKVHLLAGKKIVQVPSWIAMSDTILYALHIQNILFYVSLIKLIISFN